VILVALKGKRFAGYLKDFIYDEEAHEAIAHLLREARRKKPELLMRACLPAEEAEEALRELTRRGGEIRRELRGSMAFDADVLIELLLSTPGGVLVREALLRGDLFGYATELAPHTDLLPSYAPPPAQGLHQAPSQ